MNSAILGVGPAEQLEIGVVNVPSSAISFRQATGGGAGGGGVGGAGGGSDGAGGESGAA